MPIRVYYPTDLVAILTTLSLSLRAVLERMKLMRAMSRGTRMMARVKLKFSVNRENRKMPLGLVGVSWSARWLWLSEL